MPVTALYAGLLALLLLVLSFRVIAVRRSQRVEIGDGGNRTLLRRMRVHANFVEYAPFALLLMALAETLRPPILLIHVAGLLLVAGRLTHAYGLSSEPHVMPARAAGMMMTFAAILIAALVSVAQGLRAVVL
jgi:uncharacterized membrane protein YecN with MAPEG domain